MAVSMVVFIFNVGGQADAQVGTWTTKAPIPTSVPFLVAGVIDGKLYVVGGPHNLMCDPTTDI